MNNETEQVREIRSIFMFSRSLKNILLSVFLVEVMTWVMPIARSCCHEAPAGYILTQALKFFLRSI